MSTPLDFNKKILAIITGASQGIGKTIALELNRRLASGSKLVLIARSEDKLIENKKLLADINTDVAVDVRALDLSKTTATNYETVIDSSFNPKTDTYDVGIIFHNAGQVGKLTKSTELRSFDEWRSFYDTNLFSASILNSVFLDRIKPHVSNTFVVNISSFCGVQAVVNMGMYCSAKAARNLFFGVVAAEEPDVAVLNYSPGPVETDMFNTIAVSAQSEALRVRFKGMREDKQVLSTAQTVAKLLDVLGKGGYKSGDFVDYFERKC